MRRLPFDTPLSLRPDVFVHYSDESETILFDGNRTVPLIGSVFKTIIERVAQPTTVGELLETYDAGRSRSLARLATQRLLSESLLIVGHPTRRNWLLSDYVLRAGQKLVVDQVVLRSAGLVATEFASRMEPALRDIGIGIEESGAPSHDSPIIALLSEPEAIHSLSTSSKDPLLILVPGVEQVIAGPFVVDPAVEWPILAGRIALLSELRTSPLQWSALPESVKVLGAVWAAGEILRWLSESTRRLHQRRLRSFHLGTGSVREHPLLGFEAEASDAVHLDTAEPPRIHPDSGSSTPLRVEPEELTLSRLHAHIDQVGGVVTLLQEVLADPINVVITMHNEGSHQRSRLGSSDGFVAASGKGYSKTAAIVSCIGEAIERFSCAFPHNASIAFRRADSITDEYLHPAKMLAFSNRQYLERSIAADGVDARPGIGFNWVPPKFQEDQPIGWVRGIRIDQRRSAVFLPAALTYFNYNDPREHCYGYADSNGCAAGQTLAESCLHAILELIERDACAIWWYNALSKREVHMQSDEAAADTLNAIRARGRRVHLLDITSDLGVPVCACISADHNGRQVHIGLGASVTMDGAARRALSEMVQVGVVDVEAMPQSPKDRVQQDILDWYRNASLSELAYLNPRGDAEIDRKKSPKTVPQSLDWLLGILRDRNLPVYAVNMSRVDLPLKAVRIVVPGLRHFWRRLAPGRLYDVPVAMGDLSKPLSEDELNPISYFL